MQATEETLYNQPILHRIFAVASVGMLISIVWMIAADHYRPWKRVQREFHQIEDRKLKAVAQEKLAEQKTNSQTRIDEINAQIQQAEADSVRRSSDLRRINQELNRLGGRVERLNTDHQFKKTEIDGLRTVYDGMILRGEQAEAQAFLETKVAAAERELGDLARELEKARAEKKAKDQEKEALRGGVDNLVKERERLTREVDRVERLIAQKESEYFGVFAWLRSLPGLDMAASPTKIQQISLPELTINYNFKEVPRYDRCATCHLGIDRPGYQTDADGQAMPPVFASHPQLEHGATILDPKGNPATAGLFLDPNGPHPINDFGCTICHAGQGSGTDFSFASHSPNTPDEADRWRKAHGWEEVHHWDYPMLPSRFIESSCVKCHQQVTDIPQAEKLQAGYNRVVKYGCVGCHSIGGDGSFGPDLTDERQVGPSFAHIGSKVSEDWLFKWIKDPSGFRPDTRMPRFYGLSNNDAPEDQAKTDAEIHAITAYLLAKSEPPADFVDPPDEPDAERGKELFLQKGCLACHQHRPYQTTGEDSEIAIRDRAAVNPDYELDPEETYDPEVFPEAARKHAKADFGPNLSNIAAKFQTPEQGLKWLTNWINAPEKHHPESLMPNLQLSLEDSADIAAWLLSVPGQWPVKVEGSPAESNEVRQAVDELVGLYVSKGGYRKDGKPVAVALAEVDSFVAGLPEREKLQFLGEKTIGRLGCFGCHEIPGFENAKPIGAALSDWGAKSPSQLDFGHVREYLESKGSAESDDGDANVDGVDPYYRDELERETRIGFLHQKLHRPRSFDYLKKSELYKSWDDRLRMPQFPWADDPKAVEEVMTFILGLTNERVNPRYVARNQYDPAKIARAEGTKLLDRYNCAGCHVLEMPAFEIAKGTKTEEALTNFHANLRTSYNARNTDFLPDHFPGVAFDPEKKLDDADIESALGVGPDDGAPVTIKGMIVDSFDEEISVQLWEPVTIRGYAFNIGDNLTIDRTKVKEHPPVGGDFAWLYSIYQGDETGDPLDSFWNRLPPPLVREGLKVQTPWLSKFLEDPRAIRPAVQLRMPRYHYGAKLGGGSRETDQLANYFAARDGAEFPYQTIPNQQQSFLAAREREHPGRLDDAWSVMAHQGSPCLQCHAIGASRPEGGEDAINGPDLRGVAERFRPDYLELWLANPRRLLPYTAMPQNVAPRGPSQVTAPKSFEDQPLEMLRALRDALLNYGAVLEKQLAAEKSPTDGDEDAKPAG